MARQKRGFMDDGLDSSGGSDSGMDDADDTSFNRKRRRRGWESDEDEEEEQKQPVKRSDWAKAPAFVSGNKAEETMELDSEDAGSRGGSEEEDDGEDGEGDAAEDSSDDVEPSKPSPRRPQEEHEDEDMDDVQPRIGGIGASRSGLGATRGSTSTPSFAHAGGIGASTSMPRGLGSSASSVPSAFASSRSTSFVRDTAPKPPTVLPPAEQAHFSKISGSIGARLLAKMGWQAGTGLGASGEGIVTPVESKMRPERSGIAFQGFKEKTEQSKMEAKRRGEEVSDDEDEKIKKAKRKVREVKEKRSEAWKKPKKVKTKVEHKTYEQIIAEAGAPSTSTSGIGQIIDATGAVPREVSSLADVSLNSWTPSSDPTRIPEVRHNIRIITDACKSDLDGLAREAKSLDERKKFAAREDLRLRKQVEQEAERISRLQQVQLVATEISATSKQLASVYEVSLDPLSPLFYRLGSEFAQEIELYRLDEIVVAAIAPLIRRLVADWNPLQDPSAFMSTFRNWRPVLRINVQAPVEPQDQIDVYGARTTVTRPVDILKPMTPFESLLWNVWLPKVRSSVNNEWDPTEPQPAVKLYEAWSTFLPPFIRDNLLDQLILPKVQKAVAEWKPKQSTVSLQMIVFPWLPHVGLRLEDVVGDARRKMKSLLRAWTVGDPVPKDLVAWRDVFSSGDWDSILLKYIVPKLGATLRTDFRVNPRNQSMEPLQRVLEWSPLIRPSVFSQILETEFIPKWLDVLHVWLIQPNVSFGEVAQWYSFWKDSFPEEVRNMEGVERGFTRGLDLMNTAIALGSDAPTKLVKPDFRAEMASPPGSPKAGRAKTTPTARPSARTQEITFRSIVEEFVASNNLLFIPAGKVHELSRIPLYRVSPTADGKGGLLIYILDDAVWASAEGVGGPSDEYRAISLDEMIVRASQ